jgi:hypothetical protein
MKYLSHKNDNLIFSGFILLYLIVTILLAINLDFFEDEIYTLKSTDGNIFTSFKQAIYFEGQQPLYFVFLNIWRALGNGVFIARLFSVLSIIFSIFLIFKLSKIYFPDFNPFYAVLLFACNPFVIWAANEARLYALALLIGLLLVYFFYKGFYANKPAKTDRLLYYISAFVGFYTFYFFSFLLFAHGFSLLIKKRYRDFKYYAGIMLLLLVPYIFIYRLTLEQINMISYLNKPAIHFIERLRIIFRGTQHYLVSFQMIPMNNMLKLALLTSLFFIILLGIYKLIIKVKNEKLIDNSLYVDLIFHLLVIYALYLVVLNVFPHLNFNERYMVVVYPLLTLFLVGFIKMAVSNLNVQRIVFGLILLVFLVSDLFQYRNFVKIYDYKKVNEYIGNDTKDIRPILFYRACHAPILSNYYKGANVLIPLPDSASYRTDYLSRIESDLQLDSIFIKLTNKYSKFCLVTDDQIDYLYAVNLNRGMLQRYIDKHFITEKDTLIMGREQYYLRVRNLHTN